MNPLVMKLADGSAFFVGMGAVVLAVVAMVWLRQRSIRTAISLVVLLGVLLIVLSSTPLPIGQYVVWGLFLTGAMVTVYRHRPLWEGMRIRLLAVGLFVALSAMLSLQEMRFHWGPTIPVRADQRVYVIGDSLSAGIGQKERVWPAVLGDRTGLSVTNLAVGGAKLADALNQARTIEQYGALVLVEIGGNDILGNGKPPTETATFYRRLEELLALLTRRQLRIAMFELPLPPFGNGYGKAQRKLAAKYNVDLIPKSYLADTLALPEGTIDGLHLSQKGHDYLAGRVTNLLVVGDRGPGR